MYHDGQFDDSRLGINMVQTIHEQGGVALNYMRVTELIKTTDGKMSGVIVSNEETGTAYTINAKTVVNATGVFVDKILQKDSPDAKDIVQPSQGVYVVVDKEFLPSKYALMIPKTRDGKVLFAAVP